MKMILNIILIIAFGSLAGVYFPFWSLAIVAFAFSIMIRTRAISSFLSGFIAIFILWFMLAFLTDRETDAILTTRVATIFSLSNIGLMGLTGLIGGLVGGMGAISGTLLADLFKKKRKSRYY